jgi:poly-gamma-glutamate synthesis protein (capsule biosynthesis protein)
MEPPAAKALAEFGFDALCLANNHTFDHGDMGHVDTRAVLEKHGVRTFGTGSNLAEAEAGLVVEVGGLRIGLLGLMEPYGRYVDKYHYFAGAGHEGVAPLTEEVASRAIRAMRKRADTVVVYVHWGENYAAVTEGQRRWARKLVNWGADVVVGHHSHVAQAVEMIDGVPVLYSLGNFAFCTKGRFHEVAWVRRHGWVATIVIDAEGVKRVELVAIATDNSVVFFEPRPVSAQILRRILDDLNKPFGTKAQIAGNRAIINVREGPGEQPQGQEEDP